MNELTTLLVYLLGASALGCIIGWCISSIFAARNENRLLRRFASERRILADQVDESQDESVRLNGLLNKARLSIRNHENHMFMSKQTVKADAQHKIDKSREQIGALQLELERSKGQIGQLEQQVVAQELKFKQQLETVAKASQANRAEAASRQHAKDSAAALNGNGNRAVLPVLKTRRGPDVLPENYDGLAGVSSVDDTSWLDIDTEKYDFLSAGPATGSSTIEVDDDIMALSETGVFDAYQQNRESPKSVQATEFNNNKKDQAANTVAMVGAASNERAAESIDATADFERPGSPPAAGQARTAGRSEGLFSRFNKRNK